MGRETTFLENGLKCGWAIGNRCWYYCNGRNILFPGGAGVSKTGDGSVPIEFKELKKKKSSNFSLNFKQI